jgi:hypothetical protein
VRTIRETDRKEDIRIKDKNCRTVLKMNGGSDGHLSQLFQLLAS